MKRISHPGLEDEKVFDVNKNQAYFCDVCGKTHKKFKLRKINSPDITINIVCDTCFEECVKKYMESNQRTIFYALERLLDFKKDNWEL